MLRLRPTGLLAVACCGMLAAASAGARAEAGAAAAAAPADAVTPAQDEAMRRVGLRVAPPPGWTWMHEGVDDRGYGFVAPDAAQPDLPCRFIVRAGPVTDFRLGDAPPEKQLAGVVDRYRDGLLALRTTDMEPPRDVVIDGVRAVQFAATTPLHMSGGGGGGERTVRSLTTLTIADGRFYSAAYTAAPAEFEKRLPDARAVLASMRFAKKPQVAAAPAVVVAAAATKPAASVAVATAKPAPPSQPVATGSTKSAARVAVAQAAPAPAPVVASSTKPAATVASATPKPAPAPQPAPAVDRPIPAAATVAAAPPPPPPPASAPRPPVAVAPVATRTTQPVPTVAVARPAPERAPKPAPQPVLEPSRPQPSAQPSHPPAPIVTTRKPTITVLSPASNPAMPRVATAPPAAPPRRPQPASASAITAPAAPATKPAAPEAVVAAEPIPAVAKPAAARDVARKTYTDATGSFAISVPATWKPGKAPPTRLALVLNGPSAVPDRNAPPIFRAQVGRQQPGQPARPLDEFCRALIEQVTKDKADAVKIVPTTVDGVDGRQFILTLQDARSMDIDMKYVVVLKPPHSFIFTYLQERGLLDTDEADALFSSIRWTK